MRIIRGGLVHAAQGQPYWAIGDHLPASGLKFITLLGSLNAGGARPPGSSIGGPLGDEG